MTGNIKVVVSGEDGAVKDVVQAVIQGSLKSMGFTNVTGEDILPGNALTLMRQKFPKQFDTPIHVMSVSSVNVEKLGEDMLSKLDTTITTIKDAAHSQGYAEGRKDADEETAIGLSEILDSAQRGINRVWESVNRHLPEHHKAVLMAIPQPLYRLPPPASRS